jgi:hypothetical protein
MALTLVLSRGAVRWAAPPLAAAGSPLVAGGVVAREDAVGGGVVFAPGVFSPPTGGDAGALGRSSRRAIRPIEQSRERWAGLLPGRTMTSAFVRSDAAACGVCRPPRTLLCGSWAIHVTPTRTALSGGCQDNRLCAMLTRNRSHSHARVHVGYTPHARVRAAVLEVVTPGWLSHLPPRLRRRRTAVCSFVGEVDGEGRPHGYGEWRDSHYHGEHLRCGCVCVCVCARGCV